MEQQALMFRKCCDDYMRASFRIAEHAFHQGSGQQNTPIAVPPDDRDQAISGRGQIWSITLNAANCFAFSTAPCKDNVGISGNTASGWHWTENTVALWLEPSLLFCNLSPQIRVIAFWPIPHAEAFHLHRILQTVVPSAKDPILEHFQEKTCKRSRRGLQDHTWAHAH